jgi:hypothetical protein
MSHYWPHASILRQDLLGQASAREQYRDQGAAAVKKKGPERLLEFVTNHQDRPDSQQRAHRPEDTHCGKRCALHSGYE